VTSAVEAWMDGLPEQLRVELSTGRPGNYAMSVAAAVAIPDEHGANSPRPWVRIAYSGSGADMSTLTYWATGLLSQEMDRRREDR
jgi:hypothetical protein